MSIRKQEWKSITISLTKQKFKQSVQHKIVKKYQVELRTKNTM